ncbi:DinB family protein [Pedobacter kyonggii]|uniref:DinB family protein n=1 Tax=Pedobacter kyonggii TaxID=1926871 RepID=A0A4Q9HF88_9SPHI|nr:DinB family protein [Pedobacter kyonggii]TBO43592.1 DinB family protein [Pedobacter kyonggii]
MPLKEPITNLLEQLHGIIGGLTNTEFTHPLTILSGSTIGQHGRHILEFYLELNKGYAIGEVDYDRRERNHAVENDKEVAQQCLREIICSLGKPDRKLVLVVNYDAEESQSIRIQTNYYRELIYNLEHTVHHMALIRIGIGAISAIEIPAGFGIAASTLKYRQGCAP